MIPWCRKK